VVTGITQRALCEPPNYQLQRTVIGQCVRAASASVDYALVARRMRDHAAAEPERHTARTAFRAGQVNVPLRHVG
jgi:hypothetical protein